MDRSGTIAMPHCATFAETDSQHAPPHFDLNKTAILLDVDGTILEIAPAPDLVHVPDDLVVLLAQLNERTGGALALISGRKVHDLDALFAPLKLAAVGCHGVEVRLDVRNPAVARTNELDPALRQALCALQDEGKGIVVEDKVFAVALHYRLAPHLASWLEQSALAVLEHYPNPEIGLMHGKAVIEVKRAGVSKGTAFRDLMRVAPFAGRRAVFLGDDVTDETVFAALPEFGGYGISVGRSMKGARFCFSRAADVRAWLASLLED
jgi:trehalose 6-phosphate phosphatase